MPAPIEDYALLGDCESAALVSRDGSIDWLCWPRFDSSACFAALLGTPEHGRWSLAPAAAGARVSRRYVTDTIVLETEWETADGAATVYDFMPVRDDTPDLVRLVVGRRGRVAMRTELVVRFAYGTAVPWVTRIDETERGETHADDRMMLRMIAGPDMVVLRTPIELRGEGLTTVGDFSVSAGESVAFTLSYGASHEPPPRTTEPHAALEATIGVLARVGRQVHLPRRGPRGGGTIADHPQGTHLRANGRHRCRADNLAPRATRRRAQLGLPLLLVAGCDADASRAHQRRL